MRTPGLTDSWFAGERTKYGMDHPSWQGPTNFRWESEEKARAAIIRAYGERSEHVVVCMRVIPSDGDHR